MARVATLLLPSSYLRCSLQTRLVTVSHAGGLRESSNARAILTRPPRARQDAPSAQATTSFSSGAKDRQTWGSREQEDNQVTQLPLVCGVREHKRQSGCPAFISVSTTDSL